jgi:hypothetical protein
VKQVLKVKRHMSQPNPIEPYYFQANLIWRDGPFKIHKLQLTVWVGINISLYTVPVTCFAVHCMEQCNIYAYPGNLNKLSPAQV